MKAKAVLILMAVAQTSLVALSHAQSSQMIGSWRVEITFGNGEKRSLRFEARESGKGSFLLVDPKSNYWGPARPAMANWSQSDESSVIFSGPVEFPLGNVGRDAGTLVLKGKFGDGSTITGEAKFFRGDENPTDPKATAAKSGTFRATRVTG